MAGREESATMSPPLGSIERLTNWSELYERYTETLDITRRGIEPRTENRPVSEIQTGRQGGLSAADSKQVGEASRRGGKRAEDEASTGVSAGYGQSSDVLGRQPRDRSDPNRRGNAGVPIEPSGAQPQEKGIANQSDVRGSGGQAAGQPRGVHVGDSEPKLLVGGGASSFQAVYTAHSSGANDSVLTPKNMAEATVYQFYYI